jgi:hypothetical protein
MDRKGEDTRCSPEEIPNCLAPFEPAQAGAFPNRVFGEQARYPIGVVLVIAQRGIARFRLRIASASSSTCKRRSICSSRAGSNRVSCAIYPPPVSRRQGIVVVARPGGKRPSIARRSRVRMPSGRARASSIAKWSAPSTGSGALAGSPRSTPGHIRSTAGTTRAIPGCRRPRPGHPRSAANAGWDYCVRLPLSRPSFLFK